MFCGDRASSKEDAWPRWLADRFQSSGGVTVDAQRGDQRLPSWQAIGHHIKVKFVCTVCNNGWMSRLESQVKPIVEPLLGEANVTLDIRDQSTLAAWAVKTAMVFEALRLSCSRWFYEDQERADIRANLSPPHRTNVWIAKCVDLPGALCAASDLSDMPGDNAESVRGYTTTMGIGPLALQVLTIRVPTTVPPDAAITAAVRPGPWDRAILRIWPDPQAPVAWPPSIGLRGAEGLEALSERWRVPT